MDYCAAQARIGLIRSLMSAYYPNVVLDAERVMHGCINCVSLNVMERRSAHVFQVVALCLQVGGNRVVSVPCLLRLMHRFESSPEVWADIVVLVLDSHQATHSFTRRMHKIVKKSLSVMRFQRVKLSEFLPRHVLRSYEMGV